MVSSSRVRYVKMTVPKIREMSSPTCEMRLRQIEASGMLTCFHVNIKRRNDIMRTPLKGLTGLYSISYGILDCILNLRT